MKIILHDTGVAIVLSNTDQGTLLRHAHPSKYTTRQLLEALVAQWTANLDQDCSDMIKELEEADNGSES